MKFAWTRMKGVCQLLLGLAMTVGGRGLAAEINTDGFAKLAESSSAAPSGKSEASPFKDESAANPARAVPIEPVVPACSPCSSSCAAGIARCDNDCFSGAPGRVWFSGEYLHWWTSGAHLPPMVSTLDPNNPMPATTLTTVFGNRDIRDGSHDGYRMDLGMWLDGNHCWGLEADYFDVTGRRDGYDSGLTAGIPTPIARAFFDPASGITQGSINAIGYPNLYAGRVTVDTLDYFQSAGLWFRHQLRASEWSTNGGEVNWTDHSARTFRLDAIGGYRFARLIDTVNERDDSVDISGTATTGNTFTSINNYRTVNNFNGCELGLNTVFTAGRWSLDVVTKAAFGANNQYASLYNLNATDTTNTGGGVTSNAATALQEFSRNRFSWIPELTVTGGFQVTDHLKVTAGYDLLYWTAVVRAADQIAVQPTTGYPYGSLVGTTLPPFAWNESHFLAQGLRLGAEVRF